VSAHEVAAPHVVLHEETVEPDAARGRLYAAAKERMAELTRRLHG
jgi:hypothetical protein